MIKQTRNPSCVPNIPGTIWDRCWVMSRRVRDSTWGLVRKKWSEVKTKPPREVPTFHASSRGGSCGWWDSYHKKEEWLEKYPEGLSAPFPFCCHQLFFMSLLSCPFSCHNLPENKYFFTRNPRMQFCSSPLQHLWLEWLPVCTIFVVVVVVTSTGEFDLFKEVFFSLNY